MPTIHELLSRATQLQHAGQLMEAAALYEQVVRAEPSHAQAWQQLGLIAMVRGQLEAAFEYFRRAILLDGSQAAFHHNMGSCCRSLGKLAEAQASYEQTLRLDSNYPGTRVHLCFTLFARGRLDEAERRVAETLQRPRSFAEDHAALATLLISCGRFLEGWEEHEWRAQLPMHREPRATVARAWNGSPLAGRSILVYSEQGLGDTLQLMRYLPLMKEQAGEMIFAVQRALVPLVEEAQLGRAVARDDPWPTANVEVGMWSLPHAFHTTLETVPANVPYLRANSTLVAKWRERLAPYTGLRVGIHWQGNPAYNLDRARSIPLEHFLALANIPGVRLFNLQKGFDAQRFKPLGESLNLVDWGPELDPNGDFMDTAALMKNLDLVIACDSATAHLSGALGVTTWLPMSAMCDWRWMRDRDDSPWYPSTRLFRQKAYGDWPEVFARMAAELRSVAAADETPAL